MSASKPWHWAWRVRSRPPSGAKTIRYSALTGSIGPGPRVICRNPKAGRSMALNHRGAPPSDHHGDFDEPQSEPVPGTGPRDVVPLLLESPRLDEGGTLLVQGGYFSEEVPCDGAGQVAEFDPVGETALHVIAFRRACTSVSGTGCCRGQVAPRLSHGGPPSLMAACRTIITHRSLQAREQGGSQ